MGATAGRSLCHGLAWVKTSLPFTEPGGAFFVNRWSEVFSDGSRASGTWKEEL
jgi:hypothetical protein